MSTYGIGTAGLNAKPATQSKADFDAAFKAIFGDSVGSDPDGGIPAATSLGQEVAILTESESAAWDMLQILYAGSDPNQAVGPQLDFLCALTGVTRKAAAYSQAQIACYGTIGTILPIGRVVTTSDLGTRFDSLATATLAAVSTAWTALTVYPLAALVTANAKIWLCIGAGVSTTGTGPTGTGEQTDGTVTWWPICATGNGVALATYQAEATGPLGASQDVLTQIATPVSGWAGCSNGLPATLGRDVEIDVPLRGRRVLELAGSGGGPADAIRAALLKNTAVTACIVLVNSGDAVDANGTPAHGVQVLVASTLDDAVLGALIWAAVGAGTATGNALGTPHSVAVVDATGTTQTILFSTPADVEIAVTATVYYDPAAWPSLNPGAAVVAAVESAIYTFGETYYQIGYQVRASAIESAIFDGPSATTTSDAGVTVPILAPDGSPPAPGIVDVESLVLTRSGNPSFTISAGELAVLDPANMSITAVAKSPWQT